jgi:hypothetical protein
MTIKVQASVICMAWIMVLCGCGTGGSEGPGQAVERDEASAQQELDALRAIGYLGGVEDWDGEVGVTVSVPERSFPGLNFYVSGHAAEALLIDMEGRELQRWSHSFDSAFPDAEPLENARDKGRHHWRRAYLQPDGGLVAIFDGQGLIRIDRDSNLVWASRVRAHHAAQVMPDGTIIVLSAAVRPTRAFGEQVLVAEDFVAFVDAETGVQRRRISVMKALLNSDFRYLLDESEKQKGDILHTNSLEVLDGRFADAHPAFRAGNVLLSSRVSNAIFVLDLEAERVVWARTGSWRGQHDPRMLDSGAILLFDNGTRPRSRVLELALDSDEERVVYGAGEQTFFTAFCGVAARLPNGNTLIVETGSGRAFEVTPAGERVWEFINPHRSGDEDEKIAVIFDLVRVPEDAVGRWK